jgi:hypothetical protein
MPYMAETGDMRRASPLGRVDQVAMEVHPAFGEVAHLHALLVRHGFRVKVTDNDGRLVPPGLPAAAYLYATQCP